MKSPSFDVSKFSDRNVLRLDGKLNTHSIFQYNPNEYRIPTLLVRSNNNTYKECN